MIESQLMPVKFLLTFETHELCSVSVVSPIFIHTQKLQLKNTISIVKCEAFIQWRREVECLCFCSQNGFCHSFRYNHRVYIKHYTIINLYNVRFNEIFCRLFIVKDYWLCMKWACEMTFRLEILINLYLIHSFFVLNFWCETNFP